MHSRKMSHKRACLYECMLHHLQLHSNCTAYLSLLFSVSPGAELVPCRCDAAVLKVGSHIF